MKTKSGIFLGKSGEVFGPYSENEYQAMMTSGEVSKYTWIWDAGKEQWNPLEEPPPHPMGGTSSSKGSKSKQGSIEWSTVQALCYDSSNMIHGELSSVTRTGCQLKTQSGKATSFAVGAAVMNLFDPSGDKCISVPIRVLAIEPDPMSKGWRLMVRWNDLPGADL